MTVIPELVNLANGSAAAGDKLAAKICRDAIAKIERLQAIVGKLHPRVSKLLAKGRRFIVIGEHEPYFVDAYRLVRIQEQAQGTWTVECEDAYQEAKELQGTYGTMSYDTLRALNRICSGPREAAEAGGK